jgi:hypothetical protein
VSQLKVGQLVDCSWQLLDLLAAELEAGEACKCRVDRCKYCEMGKRACPALVTAEASPAAAHVYNILSLQAKAQTATAPPVSQLQVCQLAEGSWQLLDLPAAELQAGEACKRSVNRCKGSNSTHGKSVAGLPAG